MSGLPRNILTEENKAQTVQHLQACLTDLIDLALQGKQAHWNLVGARFRSFHLQLDEIILTVRDASDEVAERIQTISASADGRASTVARSSRLSDFPEGLIDETKAVTLYADRLMKTIEGMREAIAVLGDTDPVSEDILVGIAGQLEKHLWMVQAQEAKA